MDEKSFDCSPSTSKSLCGISPQVFEWSITLVIPAPDGAGICEATALLLAEDQPDQ